MQINIESLISELKMRPVGSISNTAGMLIEKLYADNRDLYNRLIQWQNLAAGPTANQNTDQETTTKEVNNV